MYCKLLAPSEAPSSDASAWSINFNNRASSCWDQLYDIESSHRRICTFESHLLTSFVHGLRLRRLTDSLTSPSPLGRLTGWLFLADFARGSFFRLRLTIGLMRLATSPMLAFGSDEVNAIVERACCIPATVTCGDMLLVTVEFISLPLRLSIGLKDWILALFSRKISGLLLQSSLYCDFIEIDRRYFSLS
jgi:hypothetical protein